MSRKAPAETDQAFVRKGLKEDTCIRSNLHTVSNCEIGTQKGKFSALMPNDAAGGPGEAASEHLHPGLKEFLVFWTFMRFCELSID